MYLNDNEEAEVLLRLIADCERLVDEQKLTGDAAFAIVNEAAKHHGDHPTTKAERLREYEEKQAANPCPPPTPEPTPVVVESAPADEVMPF